MLNPAVDWPAPAGMFRSRNTSVPVYRRLAVIMEGRLKVWSVPNLVLLSVPDERMSYSFCRLPGANTACTVALLSDAAQPRTIHGTKAVGEPPLMLAIAVREAIRDAVAAFGGKGKQVELKSPATAEAILGAILKGKS